tara:strand:- start:7821 stop:9488 length:1668 start_codon:yes stop_codon:yes gene_type:complete
MILSLLIKNIIFIQELEIDFETGLIVFTGETGAGKSIILDSISLALGSKGNSSLVRNGCEYASITIVVKNDQKIKEIIDSLNIEDYEDIQIKRIQYKDGRTKSYINDNLVSLSTVRKIGSKIVEVHGQNEDLDFINPSNHINIIDSVGDYHDMLSSINEISQNIEKKLYLIEETKKELQSIKDLKSYYEDICKDIESLQINDDEEDELLEKRKLAKEKNQITESLQKMTEAINKDNGIKDEIGRVRKELTSLDNLRDSDVESLNNNILLIEDAIENILASADSVFQKIDSGTNNVDFIEQRLFTLRSIARKYSRPIKELINFYTETKSKLSKLEYGESSLISIENEYKELVIQYDVLAKKITTKRTETANKFDTMVLKELEDLRFGNINFKTFISEGLSTDKYGPKGKDFVVIKISTSKDHEMEQINKIASGGELSRIILAIKSVLSKQQGAGTLIFDEIDSNVGGATATAIGKKLVLLASRLQIFSVTHSPQVAAKAHHHYLIEKINPPMEGKTSDIRLKELNKQSRIEELARMLSGEKITNEAREAAKSLLHG